LQHICIAMNKTIVNNQWWWHSISLGEL